MAKMGLSVRDDPPKVVDLSLYSFGEPGAGLALAVRQIPREDREALASVSVVIRNVGQQAKILTVPGWIAFYRFEVRRPDGTLVPLSPFGRSLTSPERRNEQFRVSLAPGEFSETEVPLGSIFSLKQSSRYVAQASCEPGDGAVLKSNEIEIV